jgi:hypothetical protein
MMHRKTISPTNFQFFISDASLPENAQPEEKIRILFNGQCITVPCAYWDETETELTVGAADEVDQPSAPLFDEMLPTPSRSILFTDVACAELLAYATPTETTRIRIWTDGLEFPEHVVVSIG